MAHRLDSIHRFHFVVVNHQTVVHERTNGDAQERRGWCRGWAGTAGETATTTCDIPGRLDACGCSFSSLYFHRPFSHFPPFLIIYYFVPFLYYIDFVSNIGGQVKKKKSRLRKFAGMKLAFTPKWTNWASESRQVNESPRLGLGTQHQLLVPWSGLRLHPQRRLKKKKRSRLVAKFRLIRIDGYRPCLWP